jgi:hypothetical protein
MSTTPKLGEECTWWTGASKGGDPSGFKWVHPEDPTDIRYASRAFTGTRDVVGAYSKCPKASAFRKLDRAKICKQEWRVWRYGIVVPENIGTVSFDWFGIPNTMSIPGGTMTFSGVMHENSTTTNCSLDVAYGGLTLDRVDSGSEDHPIIPRMKRTGGDPDTYLPYLCYYTGASWVEGTEFALNETPGHPEYTYVTAAQFRSKLDVVQAYPAISPTGAVSFTGELGYANHVRCIVEVRRKNKFTDEWGDWFLYAIETAGYGGYGFNSKTFEELGITPTFPFEEATVTVQITAVPNPYVGTPYYEGLRRTLPGTFPLTPIEVDYFKSNGDRVKLKATVDAGYPAWVDAYHQISDLTLERSGSNLKSTDLILEDAYEHRTGSFWYSTYSGGYSVPYDIKFLPFIHLSQDDPPGATRTPEQPFLYTAVGYPIAAERPDWMASAFTIKWKPDSSLPVWQGGDEISEYFYLRAGSYGAVVYFEPAQTLEDYANVGSGFTLSRDMKAVKYLAYKTKAGGPVWSTASGSQVNPPES